MKEVSCLEMSQWDVNVTVLAWKVGRVEILNTYDK
jgi:hypothetical protein